MSESDTQSSLKCRDMNGHLEQSDFGTATKNFRTQCPPSMASVHCGTYPESQSSLDINFPEKNVISMGSKSLLYLAM